MRRGTKLNAGREKKQKCHKSKEECILELETQNTFLHLQLAEVLAHDTSLTLQSQVEMLEQSLQEEKKHCKEERLRRKVLHNTLVRLLSLTPCSDPHRDLQEPQCPRPADCRVPRRSSSVVLKRSGGVLAVAGPPSTAVRVLLPYRTTPPGQASFRLPSGPSCSCWIWLVVSVLVHVTKQRHGGLRNRDSI
ncbi:kinesin-like protein KIF25-like [Arapaima gigas]